MNDPIKGLLLILFFLTVATGQNREETQSFPLETTDSLTLINVQALGVELNGKAGLRVEKAEQLEMSGNYQTLVLIDDSDFRDGTIELEIAGAPAADAPPQSRGFVGLAFRITNADEGRYECFYLRPMNGRADDQLQRNHAVQYVSHPEYPWYRLRKEQPGVYESYVDLAPGEWTRVRIVVSGEQARLFVHDAAQPALIVNDLKHGDSTGQIGLWLHSSTVAHYRDLRITHAHP